MLKKNHLSGNKNKEGIGKILGKQLEVNRSATSQKPLINIIGKNELLSLIVLLVLLVTFYSKLAT